jgi:hypothetical protein
MLVAFDIEYSLHGVSEIGIVFLHVSSAKDYGLQFPEDGH